MRGRRAQIASAVCGIACAVCVLAYMASVRGEADRARAEALAQYGGEHVEVCVATRDIAPGEAVDASAVETRLWVADLLPRDAVLSVEDVSGLCASSSILEGEVISLRRFERADALIEVPDGLTAVSVPAEDVQAVGGAVAPGSRVDVYATGTSTTLIGQDVLVLATSASVSAEDSGADVTWATLAVEPQSVQELVAAAQGMELYFALPANREAGASGKATSAKEGDGA